MGGDTGFGLRAGQYHAHWLVLCVVCIQRLAGAFENSHVGRDIYTYIQIYIYIYERYIYSQLFLCVDPCEFVFMDCFF